MFITDDARNHCLIAIGRHIDRRDSLLITGDYGCGKTTLLKQVKTTASTIRVRSLGSLYQLLGRIAGVKDAVPHHKARYLDYRCDNPANIIIDEAQHLPDQLYPYLKIIMDAGSCIVLAGLPELREKLKARHPDVLSRLTAIKLEHLDGDDMFELVKDDFDEDAFQAIYGLTNDMRLMMSQVKNCRDYAEANGIQRIDIGIVTKFIG